MELLQAAHEQRGPERSTFLLWILQHSDHPGHNRQSQFQSSVPSFGDANPVPHLPEQYQRVPDLFSVPLYSALPSEL